MYICTVIIKYKAKMSKVYLQVEFMSGRIFEYSKEPQEGYEKYTSTKGNTSYRKYHKGITAELDSVSIRDTKIGREVSLAFKDGDKSIYLPFALLDQKGFVDNTYVEDLIAKLPALQKGTVYTVNPYRFTPEGEKYARSGVSIKIGSEKVEKVLTNSYTTKEGEKVVGDIPAVTWRKDPSGKNKPSAASQEERSDYLLEVLMKEAERLKWTPSASTSYGTEKAPVAAVKGGAPVVPVNVDADDELPF